VTLKRIITIEGVVCIYVRRSVILGHCVEITKMWGYSVVTVSYNHNSYRSSHGIGQVTIFHLVAYRPICTEFGVRWKNASANIIAWSK